jgi:hypothetical protein
MSNPSPEDVAAAMKHDAWGTFVAYNATLESPTEMTYAEDWWPWWDHFRAGWDARKSALFF